MSNYKFLAWPLESACCPWALPGCWAASSLLSPPAQPGPTLLSASSDALNLFHLRRSIFQGLLILPCRDAREESANGKLSARWWPTAACLGQTCQSLNPVPCAPQLGEAVACCWVARGMIPLILGRENISHFLPRRSSGRCKCGQASVFLNMPFPYLHNKLLPNTSSYFFFFLFSFQIGSFLLLVVKWVT